MSTLRENIQINLNKLINERNMTQKEFAEMLGVSQAAVTNWVKGKNSPDIEIIAKICNLLKISINEIIDEPHILSHKKSAEFNLNISEITLIQNYNKLNEKGKEKLLEYSEDLIGNKKYTEIEQKEKHA